MTDKSTSVLESCTDALRVEYGFCSKTSVQSSGGGNEFINIKIEWEEIRTKEEDEPIAISFCSIKDEPEVSPQTFHQYLGLPSLIMTFCLSAFPHKSAPYGEWKCSVYVKYES
jgi:hypothetical protein